MAFPASLYAPARPSAGAEPSFVSSSSASSACAPSVLARSLGLTASPLAVSSIASAYAELRSLEAAPAVSSSSSSPRGAFARAGCASLPMAAPVVAYAPDERPKQDFSTILANAGRRALGGGIPGAAAMGIQVVSLMWLRTTVNYQYRYGTTTTQALKHLYKEGGVRRFYRGVGPALVQGPMSRFGDTAANAGVLTLLNESDTTRGMPIALKTALASAAAGCWRIFLMPVDALKTTMQVEGAGGASKLAAKVRLGGPSVLYHGALAAAAATWAGHYPWFFTYNTLNAKLPQYDDLPRKLVRSAVIGFTASAISDTVSNSIRVVKTTKQTSSVPITYPEVVRQVIASDGLLGLFGRGLKTKILANGLQGLLFSVLWRLGQDHYNRITGETPAPTK